MIIGYYRKMCTSRKGQDSNYNTDFMGVGGWGGPRPKQDKPLADNHKVERGRDGLMACITQDAIAVYF